MKVNSKELGKVSVTINGRHDASKPYDRLCVVTDDNIHSYISRQYVPAGINLNDSDYWQPFGTISKEAVDKIMEFQNEINIANSNVNTAKLNAQIAKDTADAAKQAVEDLSNTTDTRFNDVNQQILNTRNDYVSKVNLDNRNYASKDYVDNHGFIEDVVYTNTNGFSFYRKVNVDSEALNIQIPAVSVNYNGLATPSLLNNVNNNTKHISDHDTNISDINNSIDTIRNTYISGLRNSIDSLDSKISTIDIDVKANTRKLNNVYEISDVDSIVANIGTRIDNCPVKTDIKLSTSNIPVMDDNETILGKDYNKLINYIVDIRNILIESGIAKEKDNTIIS